VVPCLVKHQPPDPASWSRVLRYKVSASQLSKEFLASCATRALITELVTVGHWTLSCASWIHSVPRTRFPSDSFSGTTPVACLLLRRSPLPHACNKFAHVILDFITPSDTLLRVHILKPLITLSFTACYFHSLWSSPSQHPVTLPSGRSPTIIQIPQRSGTRCELLPVGYSHPADSQWCWVWIATREKCGTDSVKSRVVGKLASLPICGDYQQHNQTRWKWGDKEFGQRTQTSKWRTEVWKEEVSGSDRNCTWERTVVCIKIFAENKQVLYCSVEPCRRPWLHCRPVIGLVQRPSANWGLLSRDSSDIEPARTSRALLNW